MSWEALGAIGEIVGAAGVIISLLYLASQVRYSSRQSRDQAAQAVLDKLNTFFGQLAFTAGAGDVWTRGHTGIDRLETDEELVRFSTMMLQILRAYEEVFHYHSAGVIEDWAWRHARAPVDHVMRTPGFHEWWLLRRDWFGDDFQAFISESMTEATRTLAEDFKTSPPSSPTPGS